MAKTVKLSKPIAAHGQALSELSFREPTYLDIMTVGDEPVAVGYMEGGIAIKNINYQVIDRYVDRLLLPPADPALITQLNVRDTKKVVEAIIGFFSDEPESSTEQTNSSSSSENQSETSSS